MCRAMAQPAPAAVAQPDPASVTEDSARLPVTIGGRDYALDALVVRRPGSDKLPVALAYCKEQVKAECALIAENFTPVSQPPEARR